MTKRRQWHLLLRYEIRDEADENKDEGMDLINHGVRKILRQRRQQPQQ